jgi:lipopolysaccharide export system permease protein
VNQYGAYAGEQGRLNPILAMWAPFAVLVALIGWMYYVISHKPGGQPIGALEWAAAKMARRIKALMPKARAA